MAKYKKINQSGYGIGTPIPNIFPSPIEANRNPTNQDHALVGQIWVNIVSGQAWIASINAGGLTTWSLASPGASDVDTLTGDAGGPISPALGDIVLAGGTNIGTTGAGNTITFNLDPAITVATSITCPLYTSAAGTDVAITAPAGQDVIVQLGDAAGANFFRVRSSTPADVFTIDSTGTVTYAGLAVTGAFTQTGGVANIGTDATANNINIGTGAAVKVITLGNITGATAVNINTGTGGSAITTTNGTFAVATGTGAINLGIDAAAHTITMGNSTGATSLVFNCGTGPLNIGTNAIAHTVTIGNITGATAVNVNSGTGACAWTTTNGNFSLITGTGVINLGADAAAKTITIGNITGATAVNVNSGTGACAWTTTNGAFSLVTGTGAINLGADAAAKTLTIGNITAATAVNINTGTGGSAYTTTNGVFTLNTGTGAINIGTDAAAKTLTLGNITGATAVNVNSGTGACAWTTTNGAFSLITGTGNINLGADAAAKAIVIGNASGASSVAVNCGTGGASFGTSANAHTTTIGSTNTTSATIIQSGSGEITVTGTVKEIDAEFLYSTGDYVTFQSNPIAQIGDGTFGVPTGVTGEVDFVYMQEGFMMEQFILGAGQTILAPVMGAAGLQISLDLTATEGAEYNFGAARTNSRHAFTIGTSAAFFLEVSMNVADVTGGEPYMIGFRKVEANNATLTSYTDYAMIGLDNVAAPGNVVLKTELNSGGTINTNTTDAWADNATHVLRINVDATGNVTYLIDGLAPTATAAYQFDNADVVVPFIRITHGAAAPGIVSLQSFKCGYQA